MSPWLVAAGIVLLGTVAHDVVITTMWTTAGAGPLTARLARLEWTILQRLARGPASPLLTGAGPVILLTTIGMWLVLLWAGWSLVFASDPGAVLTSPGGQQADWAGRIYFAGFTVFTLGIGDYAPEGAFWQLATVFATVSGLGLTTLAITYLIPVVTAATDRSKQASTIATLGGQAHEIVLQAAVNGSVRYLEPVLLQLTDSLLLTAERHLSYPILHYFHPASPRTELRVQLVALDDALTLVEFGLADQVQRPHPAAVSGARAAISQVLDRARVSPAGHAATLSLEPIAQRLPTVDPEAFDDRLRDLEHRRRRLAGYAAQSRWELPGPGHPPEAS